MKTLLYILGILMIFTGIVFFLQGINILPGSFMTGQIRWAVVGILTIFIGIGELLFARQRY